MRWLVTHPGPEWSVADVHAGWVEALADLGQDVRTFALHDWLTFYDAAHLKVVDPDGRPAFRKAFPGPDAAHLAAEELAGALWRHRPDVLLVVCGALVPGELLEHARRTGTRVVLVHTEQPYELERELALSEHADLTLLNDPTHAEKFAQLGPTLYVPHAYRPGFHAPGPANPTLTADLAFVGTGFGSRRWFFEQLAAATDQDGEPALKDVDVLLAGYWPGVDDASPLRRWLANDAGSSLDNHRTVEIYRSARCGINLYRRDAADDSGGVAGWAMGPREVEMAACGMFFLRDPRPEGDGLLPMLPTFAGPAEAVELLRWWLRHDQARQDAARQAREAVADRTFGNHAAALLRILERK